MNQLQSFWMSVRERERELIADGVDEYLYITSVETPRRTTFPGRVSHVDRYNAAVLLTKGTHKLASDDEIASYERDADRRRQLNEDIEAKREGRLSVPLPTRAAITGE